MLLKSQIKKDFADNSLPFKTLLYKTGNFIISSILESLSIKSEITGREVYTLEYPKISQPLNIGTDKL